MSTINDDLRAPAPAARSTLFLLQQIGQLAAATYAATVNSLGLRAAQLRMLEVLASGSGMKQARLAEAAGVDEATAVALINGLEARTLVERRTHPSDRRAVGIHLLPTGAARVAEARRRAGEATRAFLAPLTAKEQRTLGELLSHLAEHHAPEALPAAPHRRTVQPRAAGSGSE